MLDFLNLYQQPFAHDDQATIAYDIKLLGYIRAWLTVLALLSDDINVDGIGMVQC